MVTAWSTWGEGEQGGEVLSLLEELGVGLLFLAAEAEVAGLPCPPESGQVMGTALLVSEFIPALPHTLLPVPPGK